MDNLTVSIAAKNELADIAQLAVLLWPEYDANELFRIFGESNDHPEKTILSARVNSKVIGFAMIGLRRDYVEGTESSPVGYVEGIFVLAEFRQMKIGKELLKAAERWALRLGCTEIGSDTEIENELSQAFHQKCGYKKVSTVVHFVKKLT